MIEAIPTKLQQADAVMIRYADTLSPAEIAFKLEGLLTPAQVRARLEQLLETPDWLTAAQQDQLVTLKMRQLIVRLEEANFTSRTAEILVRALEALGSRLDKRSVATDSDLSKLYAFQGRAFLDAFSAALEFLRPRIVELSATASGGTDKAWGKLLEDGIRHAQLVLEPLEASSQDATD